jgi:hypothetical protein
VDPPRNVAEWLARYRSTPRLRCEDARTVPELLRWLGQQDADRHVEWSVTEARRLLFVLWLLEHGRIDPLMVQMRDVVYIRTKAGRIHKAVKLEGRRLTDEACNLDDARGSEPELTFADLEAADPGSLCQRCWPTTKPDAELGE